MSRILLVDDDADLRSVFREKLEYSGHEVDEADSAEVALAKVGAFDPALVVTDVRMDGMTGLELLSRIRESMEYVDVIVMTGHNTLTSAVEAMKSGAFDYLVKPVSLKELVAVVDRCLSDQEINRAAIEQREADSEEADAAGPDTGARTVVGRDPRMIEIYKMIGVLSRNRATVLIRGDTGTGKEMVARAVHDHSIHSEEPFIAVNCTALTDTLLNRSSSGTCEGRSRERWAGKRGTSNLRGRARSSSTRSGTPPRTFSPSSFGCFRSVNSIRWGVNTPRLLRRVSWPRHINPWKSWYPRVASVRIYTSVCGSSRFRSRPCVKGRATSLFSLNIFLGASDARREPRCGRSQRRR